ncbi:nucleoside deaminase [Streptantibioticus cattleyicolor]|uniref:Guanine deaminase n=1 Tax=Streptantibioticus cattleyicolor (strain ATCC 35852 / DSM 46488 / JCM 4925 / NBRC 14057 / NRRL 8057) TaxID=1003195 RepID=F8JKQ1_STREN|nr:nucleoside deaminase [Streptantibioticus cattleyicolor]AEW98459.1 Guanine deaminase [Streptantibioticus cattleyicolor NRRL 8057 = DSM 46488]CCB72485.1 Cytosine/adenosine deaminase [Streptantibioticus cattleyicolor NRRL 8057 = DSM 46488]
MGHKEFLTEAVRLATEAVERGWGGPFGAVITRDGEIVARGQNRVLLTGDPTAHAEVEAIREAARRLTPHAPTISAEHRDEGTLACVPRPEGSDDPLPRRARMLKGCALYVSGAPCPMCMSAAYWARLDAVYFSCGFEATREIGFDDAFQYEDFQKPLDERRIRIEQIHPELGATAYAAWSRKPDRHPY